MTRCASALKSWKGSCPATHAEGRQEISTLESRHAEELSRVEKLYEQKLDGLLKVVESLQDELDHEKLDSPQSYGHGE